MSDIAERVEKIVRENMGITSDLSPGVSLIDDLKMDSLDLVELAIAVEEEFGFEIEDATAEKWVTVQDVTDNLERLSQTCEERT